MHRVLRTLVVVLVALLAGGLASGSPRYKIRLRDEGVYRVPYAALHAAGGFPAEVASARLGMTSAGRPVPVFVEDGGDGRFGPGDWLEFVGQRLSGERGYYHEFGETNVYWLDTDAEPAPRIVASEPAPRCTGPPPPQYRSLHLEQDRLRVRFSSTADADQEVWFWTRLTPLDEQPTTVSLSLDDVDLGSGTLGLRIHFRGWSHLPAGVRRVAAEHRVELSLNGNRLGGTEWDNAASGFTLELDVLPATLRRGENVLQLRVPQRDDAPDGRPVVDVVLLNWIELRYPREPLPPERPLRLDALDGDCLTFSRDSPRSLLLYDDGSRLRLPRGSRRAAGWRTRGPVHVVPEGEWREPTGITLDRWTDRRLPDLHADYWIVAHRTLIDAIEPLAEFYRGRGLTVEVVDVEELYDAFNHGIVHPRAIRDSLYEAYVSGRAPRFVLLVGDASWDPRNPEAADRNYDDWTFRPQDGGARVKNSFSPYREHARENHRNLIPAWSYGTAEGLAASDNGFVDLADGRRPALAIGRFPVTEPEEVAAIVSKTIRYVAEPEDGAWRERILWITDQSEAFQRRSDRLAEGLVGFASRKLYPSADEPSNANNRERLHREFDAGELLIHFYGHGGRYIWRTGPPDLQKNHDLFTLDDLDELRPNTRLPVVLSMTCYSAPFDHPSADSIGEKLLRLPGRGAVAVVAASWRNSPTYESSRLLLEEFTRPGTIGEAFLRAKQRSTDDEFVRQYNLLGDPAAPLAVPRGDDQARTSRSVSSRVRAR